MNTESVIKEFINSLPYKIDFTELKISFIDSLDVSFNKGFSDKQNTVYLDYTSDNIVNAESIKAYNVLKFSQIEFVTSISAFVSGGVVLKESFAKSVVAVVSSLFALSIIFIQNTKKKFSNTDSEVLASIYFLRIPSNIVQIQTEYELLFGKKIDDSTLESAINILLDYQTIEFDNVSNLIELKEKVIIRRI